MITITSTGPQTEPLTTDDVKKYLRILGHNLDDGLVNALIVAARVTFENYTGRFIISQVVTQTMDTFPCGNVLTLKRGPVQSVSAITGFNAASEGTELDPDTYVIDHAGQRVILKEGASWPSVEQIAAGAQIEYTAGYGDADAVPAAILQGMRHYIAHFYTNREIDVAIPPVVDALWRPFKVTVL